MISFLDKTVLVTGAANGIGKTTAELMAKAGARLFLLDQQEIQLASLAKSLQSHAKHVIYWSGDITDSVYLEHVFKDISSQSATIDHVIHCAGIYPESTVAETSDELWAKVIKVNLDSTFHLCRRAIPHLSDNSSIVTLTSVAGHRGSYAHAHYSATKGAVASFSKSLALELAPRTRVNMVAPGIISTAMTKDLLAKKGNDLLNNTPLKRFGTAEDIANVIAFLCSDLAGFITGETIHANGGIYIN